MAKNSFVEEVNFDFEQYVIEKWINLLFAHFKPTIPFSFFFHYSRIPVFSICYWAIALKWVEIKLKILTLKAPTNNETIDIKHQKHGILS